MSLHADGRGFVKDGKRSPLRPLKKFAANAKGVISRMSGAEHPLIAPHGADTPPYLVGQSLETEPAVGGCERARKAVTGALASLSCKKDSDGLFIAAVEQFFIAAKRDESGA